MEKCDAINGKFGISNIGQQGTKHLKSIHLSLKEKKKLFFSFNKKLM